ncbi:DNA recombination protein RmuC [Desulfurispora thermophila]|uniref:DNA recombination protein RmuC n=1 Tax=Desulfurispora thermophila TaxID=265470 RepID=UPI0003795F44|nr:DNA recombination protein RmuC [Desulfurispora thermophila]
MVLITNLILAESHTLLANRLGHGIARQWLKGLCWPIERVTIEDENRAREKAARAISDLGKELHERIGVLAGHFHDLRKHLEKSVESYNKAVGSLESRVLVSARRFKEPGATGAADIPALETVEKVPRRLTGHWPDQPAPPVE